MEKLPSGIMPSDSNIEIFADPENFGKCLHVCNGITKLFRELPLAVLDDLRDELFSDTKAISRLRLMGITDRDQMLEQYNYCNRGKLDHVPDITPG